MTDDPRRHPAYPQLVAAYRAAMAGWRYLGGRQTFIIRCRDYCDRFLSDALQDDPITWSGAATGDGDLTMAHCEAAYREAGGEG